MGDGPVIRKTHGYPLNLLEWGGGGGVGVAAGTPPFPMFYLVIAGILDDFVLRCQKTASDTLGTTFSQYIYIYIYIFFFFFFFFFLGGGGLHGQI